MSNKGLAGHSKAHVMQTNPPAIVHLGDPTILSDLAAAAEAEGWRMVSRLVAEWADGRNRFDRPGEHAYFAILDGRAVGVCGLNVDPFASDPAVGRVRRMYVAAAHRRSGVATAMMRQLLDDARGHFRTLHVRAPEGGACAFYESLGFTRVAGDRNCTHRRAVIA